MAVMAPVEICLIAGDHAHMPLDQQDRGPDEHARDHQSHNAEEPSPPLRTHARFRPGNQPRRGRPGNAGLKAAVNSCGHFFWTEPNFHIASAC